MNLELHWKSQGWYDRFEINGVPAYEYDFGHRVVYKHRMPFTASAPTRGVLAKYGISEDEYAEVVRRLKAGL